MEHRIAVDQLRAHVKENILYYMQRIWDHEVPDQRYYRLYNLRVEVPSPPDERISLDEELRDSIREMADLVERDDLVGPLAEIPMFSARAVPDDVADPDDEHHPSPRPRVRMEERWLADIADIDNLLGYHGNYMIFPLREHNFLTTFMALPYVGDEFSLRDPDISAEYNIESIIDRLAETSIFPDWARELWNEFEERAKEILSTRRPAREEIVVPWDHLFIEALPGTHPVLEHFKLQHRAIDAAKAGAELVEADLENLRRASRIIGGENEDDIDKKIVIEGSGITPVVST